MKVSRTVAYALRATLKLAECNARNPVPCSKLASEGAMPERFLLQILRSLVTHGILQSTRGVEGGYSLMRSPDEISLLEVIEAIDGPLITEIPAGDSEDPRPDRLQQALGEVGSAIRQQLNNIKLSHIMRPTVSPIATTTAHCENEAMQPSG